MADTPKQKLVFIMGDDPGGVGFGGIRETAMELVKKGQAIIIDPSKAADLAQIHQQINDFTKGQPAGVVIASHGGDNGQFQWKQGQPPIAYGDLFKGLGSNVKEVMADNCYGDVAMAAAKSLPSGTMLYSASSTTSVAHGTSTTMVLSDLAKKKPDGFTVGDLHDATQTIQATSVVRLVEKSKRAGTIGPEVKTTLNPTEVLSTRVAVGGQAGQVFDLNKERLNLQGKDLAPGVIDAVVATQHNEFEPNIRQRVEAVADQIKKGEPIKSDDLHIANNIVNQQLAKSGAIDAAQKKALEGQPKTEPAVAEHEVSALVKDRTERSGKVGYPDFDNLPEARRKAILDAADALYVKNSQTDPKYNPMEALVEATKTELSKPTVEQQAVGQGRRVQFNPADVASQYAQVDMPRISAVLNGQDGKIPSDLADRYPWLQDRVAERGLTPTIVEPGGRGHKEKGGTETMAMNADPLPARPRSAFASSAYANSRFAGEAEVSDLVYRPAGVKPKFSDLVDHGRYDHYQVQPLKNQIEVTDAMYGVGKGKELSPSLNVMTPEQWQASGFGDQTPVFGKLDKGGIEYALTRLGVGSEQASREQQRYSSGVIEANYVAPAVKEQNQGISI